MTEHSADYDHVILCVTPDGCTCGAPASTPAGMHHCDCAVHPGWCGEPSCLPCQENGKVREGPRRRPGRLTETVTTVIASGKTDD